MLIGPYHPKEFLGYIGRGMKVAFVEDVQLVVLGSCSNGHGNFYDPEVGLSVEQGTRNINLPFWHHCLDGVRGKVFVLTECCPQYDEKQMDVLRAEFPEITFVTPCHRDYGDTWMHAHPESVRDNLIEIKAIKAL